MATRKSQLVLTCNAQAVKDVFNYLNKELERIKNRRDELLKQFEGKMWTAEAKREFKQLGDDIAAITSMQQKNEESMRKYGQVIKDLAGSKLKDLKTALREANTALSKMSERSAGRERLINDIKRIKDQIAGTSGLTMSFSQAQKQLKSLDNISMDKLKQGLTAIKEKLDDPNIGNKWRRSLEQMQQQYQAAMAVRQAPISNRPVATMNAAQLKAEQSALTTALSATQGVKGYEQKSASYEQRLKAINAQLKELTQNEKAAEAQAKQLQATQQAAQVVTQVYRKQAVSLEDLNAAYKTLEARAQRFAGVNPAKAEATRKQMAMLAREIQRVTIAMQGEIKIDKQFLKTATNAELQNALTQLQQRMQMLTSQNSKAAAKLKADMKAVQTQIERNTGAIQKQGATFGTAIKNIAAYVGVFGAFNMIKSKVMSVYQSNLKLSDSLADIRKVSGLTSQEIDKLYTNISKIDSRNTIETLNSLAYTGAKLGIGQNYGVEGLTGFVRAAEQVQMALGEDLGEDALPALAKLTEVMNLIPKYGVEQAMQKSASAIFQLGATSTATGKNIVEFSKRLMGLANVSRISADELLGIASASDALGIMPEVGATAFNKLFTSIQKNHNMIEKSLGLVQGSINENFTKGQTIKSIVDIFESMNKKGNMNALDGIFKDLGSDGARLVAVMTTMADRVDILKTHLATSTQAFKDGTAVINEYMIQNETANALMERASNLWAKAFTNPEGIDMVKQLAEEWYEVSKSMTQSEASMYALHTSLEKITNIVSSLVQLLPFLIKMFTWMGIFGGIRMLVNSFLALRAAIAAATTATATLRVVLNSNWALAGISAVVGGISLFIDSMNAAAEAAERAEKRQAQLDEQLLKSKEKINLVTAPLESYKKALDKSNKSLDERNRLLKDLLKSEYQQYLDYLGIEIDGALDLADAYAKVVKVLKQKKAYEERERYRDEVNGQNTTNRMRAGMQFGQTAKSLGAANVDAEWLRRRHNLPVEDIISSVISAAGGSATSTSVGTVYRDKTGKVLGGKIIERLRKNIREYHTSRYAENQLNKETDELYKDAVGDFDMDKFQEEVLKGQLKRKGSLDNLKPDKDELKKQQQAQQEYKQALRKDLKDAKEDSDAIIAKIEEWYRLQESIVNGMQADGKLTKEQAEQVLRTLNIAKNTALRDARLAISGRDTKAWEDTKMQIGNLMLDQGDWSAELLEQILKVSMESIRTNLSKIDKGGGQFGITTTSLRDAIDKNAAGNQREITRLNAKAQQEVEKILLEYHYVETAIKGFSDRLAQMGILSETAESLANRMSDAEIGKYESSKADMLRAFIQSGSQKYAVNPEDSDSLHKWLNDFTGAEGGFNGFSKPFADDFQLWLSQSKTYKSEIQAFYLSLVKSEDEYYEAMKKARDKQKALFAQRWEKSGQGELFDQYGTALSNRSRELKRTGRDQGTNMMQMMGVDNLTEDPEIAASMLRMEQAQRELEMFKQTADQKKLVGEELAAFQQNLREKELAATQAEMDMQDQLMTSINARIEKLSELMDPIQEFGTELGQALYDQWHNGESMNEKWQDMLKKMGLAWGQLTIKVTSELMMQKIKQKLLNKAMQTEETIHQSTMTSIEQTGATTRELIATGSGTSKVVTEQTTDKLIETAAAEHNAEMVAEDTGMAVKENAVNTSRAAGKTLADLGWWGIPLVAVITALLNALLQAALGTSKSGSENTSSTSSSSSNSIKTKLVSGMLTYDRGNVDRFAGRRKLYDDGTTQVYGGQHQYRGSDGQSYRATAVAAPADGLVTQPIATTVQGQPALVAERGPEIVIGRRTTKAIMMNEPGLIRYLANYGKNGGAQAGPRYRTLDEGNIDTMQLPDGQTTTGGGGNTVGTDPELRNTLAALTQVVASLQQQLDKGIKSTINMYGSDGLYENMNKANKFMGRYGG